MIKGRKIRVVRRWVLFFMAALAMSGLTAIPAERELAFLSRCFPPTTPVGAFLDEVYRAVADTANKYPFLGYGNDWLAFAHVVLAMLFIGVLKDPVRNKWVIEFSMAVCVMVIPFALVAGYFRGIPIWWRLIDCSFGIVGLVPLSIVRGLVSELERMQDDDLPVWALKNEC